MTNKFFRGVLLMIALVSAAGFMYGCGSSNKEGSNITTVEQATAVGVNVCVNCHPNQKEEWLSSRHANGNGIPNYLLPDPICATCHDPLGDGYNIVNFVSGTDPRPVIGCESCHGGGSLHYGLGPIGPYSIAASATGSSQFNTCTSCHQLVDANGNPATPFHSDNPRIITDTHLGTPGNWPGGSGANTKNITGYALTYTDETVCSNCHNPHTANTAINNQWNSSRHADKTAAGAWAHYNWSRDDRKACQRCHTTTGIAAYTSYLQNGGDPAQFVGPLAQNDNWIPEMLACNGCHSNYRGGLRNPGRITETYADNAVKRYADISNSNLCLICHVGRESGDSIKAKPASFDFSNGSFVNSHYLTAGGTLFGTTGYDFTSRNYENPAFFQHDKIGLTAPDTGDKGPCISCHMSFNSDGKKHIFLPLEVERSDPDEPHLITKVVAIRSTVCAVCHGDLTVADFEEQKTLLHESMEALDVQLQKRGYYWSETNPYFFKSANDTTSANAVKNWLSPGDTDKSGNTTGKNNMGSAFNFNLIEHDPGAFVHNRFYVRRLIYDSIDWLDDNKLNYSTGATLNALPAGTTYKAGAMNYLLVNGTPTGTAAERF